MSVHGMTACSCAVSTKLKRTFENVVARMTGMTADLGGHGTTNGRYGLTRNPAPAKKKQLAAAAGRGSAISHSYQTGLRPQSVHNPP
ncbi:hypothetical protein LQG66_10910 [Bradyrhizobium ontarionense]|uniref:Uncharacterized protein n=1 Tax=Bradyrhizobium ontarionense TaxID=2898149 RepID=A0ABY3RH32_9BRAD|nr:hypothetical protein [Bradyrhizobium sp. A19]UFZ06770.1 hypothetical protein LQG66_10910 [Bradyrhizobium sp. A19]